MKLIENEIYKVDHSRKGKFDMLVTKFDENSEWVTGLITDGLANALNKDNVKKNGEEITVRKSFCNFKPLSNNKPEQGRGQLTQRIKDKSKDLFGYEITTTQLRLLPYLLSIMQNAQKIHQESINHDERKIITKWEEEGHIDRNGDKVIMNKSFWDIANEIVYLGYVDLNDK